MQDGQRRAEAAARRRSRKLDRRLELFFGAGVGLLALFVSAYTVYLQRQQLKVQAWPRLTIEADSQPGSGSEEIHSTLLLRNRGVAPAEIRTMRLAFAGTDLPSWKEWSEAVARELGIEGFEFSRTGAPIGTVIGVGQDVPLLVTSSRRTVAVMEADRETTISVCYCSMLEDCWVLDVANDEQTTTSVARCPTYAKKFVSWPREEDEAWAAGVLEAGAARGPGVRGDAAPDAR
jgi:hypothetical protein